MNGTDFFQAQLPGKHRPRHSPAAHRIGCLCACDIELRRSMELEIGKVLMRHLDEPQILHDNAVRPDIVEIRQEPVEPLHLVLGYNRIDGNIYFFIPLMQYINRCLKLIPRKV